MIAWPTGGGSADHAEARRLEILANIFSDRLFDRLRSEAGASYSPSVSSQWPVGLSSGGRLLAVGQVAPDKVAFFFKLSREIAADLVSQPVTQDELARAVGPSLQQLARVSSGNQFWLLMLSGGAYDPARVEATRNLVSDMASITPGRLQETAAKYLRPDRDWTMAVLPKRDVATR